MQTQKQTFSPIDFHHGEALLRVAGHYPTLVEVIFEQVQNALDADATNITVTIDYKKRSVVVSDDGLGTTLVKFEEALQSVCRSVKSADKLGQFGMGLIAPLGKCQKFTFTSTPRADPRGYVQWTFDTDEIQSQEKIQGVPFESLTDVHFDRGAKGHGGVPWRTQVKLINFTKDRILSRTSIASLREGILERFSSAMKRRNATVSVTINPIDGVPSTENIMADAYEGKRLPVDFVKEGAAGQTSFQLYIAKKTEHGRRGKVVVGESAKDFTISFSSFARHVRDSGFDSEAIDALLSGVFEGRIMSEKAKLDPNRKHFQESEALIDLCISIEAWYQRTGKKHMEKVREEAQDDRYQQLGLRSMKVLEALLDEPIFQYLKEVLKGLKLGTIGTHHAKPDTRILGQQPVPSTSVQGAEGGSAKKSAGGGVGSEDPRAEHPGHTPLTVTGPHGRQRMVVKGNSLGLQFLYEEMEGSSRLWDFDGIDGILRYNTRHPLWAECEADEKALMRFQEHIAVMALTLQTVPAEWRDRHRQMIDDSMPSIVFLLMRGDELAGRGRGKKSSESRQRKQ